MHPRRGPHEPRGAMPPRRPGSVRRSTTIDMVRPTGLSGPLILEGRGRDLLTRDRAVEVLDEVETRVVIDHAGGRIVESVEPPVPGLVGASASSGFRALLPPADGSVSWLLLDDVPVATLVSGYVITRLVTISGMAEHFERSRDLCAGWATDATIMLEVGRSGAPPIVTGPVVPEEETDPLAWPLQGELPADSMRRQRLLDVWRSGDVVHATSWFRDSHMSTELVWTAIHEYDVELTATLDGIVTSCTATPRSLPWVECPAAAGSAGWLVGRPLAGLRQDVRTDLTGTRTCTHLNDQLRALADVPHMLGLLPA